MANDWRQAEKEVKHTVNAFLYRSPYLLRYQEREDLVQEIMCHFLAKGLIEKYDNTITSFSYFIARAAKNHLIDMTRKRIMQTTSLNTKVKSEEDEIELGDLLEDKRSTNPEMASILIDLMEKIPEDQISPMYDLTWKKLMEYVVEGLSPKEIGKRVIVTTRGGLTRTLSSGRVSQNILRLRRMCEEMA